MDIKVDKNKMKADLLSIVEKFIENSYEEEAIRRLTIGEYVEILVAASENIIQESMKGLKDDKVQIDMDKLKTIVQSEVEKYYK